MRQELKLTLHIIATVFALLCSVTVISLTDFRLKGKANTGVITQAAQVIVGYPLTVDKYGSIQVDGVGGDISQHNTIVLPVIDTMAHPNIDPNKREEAAKSLI